MHCSWLTYLCICTGQLQYSRFYLYLIIFFLFHISSDILVPIFSFVSPSFGLRELRLKSCILGWAGRNKLKTLVISSFCSVTLYISNCYPLSLLLCLLLLCCAFCSTQFPWTLLAGQAIIHGSVYSNADPYNLSLWSSPVYLVLRNKN